ncbi:hypothetical protein B0H11DRAFT_2276762 [Mycena galericulata]|nr:hypothetical protein B0H11DRAFT_2276762 [Mycena galericulata]
MTLDPWAMAMNTYADLLKDDIDVAIAGDQGHNIRHEAAVANYEFPFQSDDTADIFARALNDAKAEEIIPLQLGVSPEEWGEGGYPETEIVKAGKKYEARGINQLGAIW